MSPEDAFKKIEANERNEIEGLTEDHLAGMYRNTRNKSAHWCTFLKQKALRLSRGIRLRNPIFKQSSQASEKGSGFYFREMYFSSMLFYFPFLFYVIAKEMVRCSSYGYSL